MLDPTRQMRMASAAHLSPFRPTRSHDADAVINSHISGTKTASINRNNTVLHRCLQIE